MSNSSPRLHIACTDSYSIINGVSKAILTPSNYNTTTDYISGGVVKRVYVANSFTYNISAIQMFLIKGPLSNLDDIHFHTQSLRINSSHRYNSPIAIHLNDSIATSPLVTTALHSGLLRSDIHTQSPLQLTQEHFVKWMKSEFMHEKEFTAIINIGSNLLTDDRQVDITLNSSLVIEIHKFDLDRSNLFNF